jgi:micrococcal nuclease
MSMSRAVVTVQAVLAARAVGAAITVAAVAVGSVVAICSACVAPGADCGPTYATVERVIDGDTILVADGRKIRYLLVDAPETTRGHSDCYGVNATQFNADLVLGKTVELTYDTTCRDDFDRTLAYVAVGGRDVGRLLVERGYACLLYLPPSGASRVDELQALEIAAKTARRGLWGACDPVPCR